MLPFDTVHAVTSCLVDAVTDPPAISTDAVPTVRVVHDYPAGGARAGWRAHRVIDLRLTSTLPLPVLLAGLADAVSYPFRAAASRAARQLTEVLTDTRPGLRLLTVAVRYDDVHIDTDDLTAVARVDAVDVDGRVYQLTRQPSEAIPMVVIDEVPEPRDRPATYSGLADLIVAGIRHTTTRVTTRS